MEYWQNLEQALVIAGLLGIILGTGLAYWGLRYIIGRHVYEDGFKAGWHSCQTHIAQTIVVTEETLSGPKNPGI
jgi:hypothetical protein